MARVAISAVTFPKHESVAETSPVFRCYEMVDFLEQDCLIVTKGKQFLRSLPRKLAILKNRDSRAGRF